MNDDPNGDPQSPEEPGNLRFLRILVTVLTATMIAGLIAIFTVIVIRFPSTASPLVLPDAITLPNGMEAEAVTLMTDRILVVAGNEILVFSTDGTLRQTIRLEN